jgi:hypothetical protein
MGMWLTVRLGSLGLGIGTVLAVKAAGWSFLPSFLVAGTVLWVSYRLLLRLMLVVASRLDARVRRHSPG